jgi:hypothetical protein
MVEGVDGLGHLLHDGQRAPRGERSGPGEDAAQVRALHDAHREVEASALEAEIVDGEHVRLVERRDERHLAPETVDELAVRRRLDRQELERHGAAEPGVPGAEGLADRAEGDPRAQLVVEEPAGIGADGRRCASSCGMPRLRRRALTLRSRHVGR